MATFICQKYPALQIYNPVSGDFIRFIGGRLDVTEDDPNFDVAMAEGLSNPAIQVLTGKVQCLHCGESFGDRSDSRSALEEHVKGSHMEVWQADQDASHAARIHAALKDHASFFCDVCRPMQEYPTESELANHVNAFHASAPQMDDEGNIVGDGGGLASVVTEVPAAKRTKRG